VRDARLIFIAAFIRAASVSLVGVTLAIHLAGVGLSVTQIGVLIAVGLAGSSLATVVVGLRADRWGRRRTLVVVALSSAAGYAALALFDNVLPLIPLAFLGIVNGMGRDRGPASALEQAALPSTVPDERRTWTLAWYHLVIDSGHAAGALAAAIPAMAAQVFRVDRDDAHHVTFALCALALVVSIVPYLALTPAIEVVGGPDRRAPDAPIAPRSRRVITRLALLFGLDSIGGGFLGSALIAYWFFVQYGTSESAIALLFFAARVLNALSHLGAAWLAQRIGLLNTMVWTHLPSSLFLMAAPAAPDPLLAALLFLAREALVEMDVPTRQSYVMAVVKPSERTFASGVTNVTRNVAWAVGPSLAGVVMQHLTLAGPLLIGGTMKIAYDLLLYRAFRRIQPPEEAARGPVFRPG